MSAVRSALGALGILGLVATAQAQSERWPPKRVTRCNKVVDVTFPADTEFPYDVPFDLGSTDLRDGDEIVIKEVRGTRRTFEVGGIYLVRGEYTLSSVDKARVSLSTTATQPGDGCTKGNTRGRIDIQRGKGTFELASPIAYPGHTHVWFRIGDESIGGVYFGRGAFLKKR